MSNKNVNLVYIGLAVALGILIGSLMNYEKSTLFGSFARNKQEAKIKQLIDNIRYEYVDEVDTDSLLDKTIVQMLRNLDPHSVYIPQKEVNKVRETMNGQFIGIGIQFRMIRDTVTVIKAIKGGPSYKAGLQAGDRILMADRDTLYGKQYNSDKIINFLKSNSPSKVDLQVYRKKTDELLDFSFKRGYVDIKSVPIYYMMDETIGYIKVELFSRTTYDEFHKALKTLKKQGLQTLILDLRNNTGGYMDIANDMIDEFLTDGTLMVFTKSKSGQVFKNYATGKGDFETGGVYVLINEESASASEIVAGAIQDNDRGLIVGRRSFGKGLVQQEMNLGDGSVVRLTTARYYTPTGRSIQKPYDHNGNKTYFHDSESRMRNGELYYEDSIPRVDSLKYTTPRGKTVYGGGGIIPDIFVPLDTTMYFRLFHMKEINGFVFDYVDERRTALDTLNFETFDTTFDIDEPLNLYLEKYEMTTAHRALLTWYLKSLLAREIFDDEAFYKVYHRQDNVIQKILTLEHQSPSSS